jgi:hypothetical protein
LYGLNRFGFGKVGAESQPAAEPVDSGEAADSYQ